MVTAQYGNLVITLQWKCHVIQIGTSMQLGTFVQHSTYNLLHTTENYALQWQVVTAQYGNLVITHNFAFDPHSQPAAKCHQSFAFFLF